MEVASINSLGLATGGGASSAAGPQSLQDEFLTMFIAQLQNQDPFNPQDPSEFTAQLAQFSSLEQMVQMNRALIDIAQLQAVTVGTSAASFVGQQAEFLSDRFDVTDGAAGQVRYNLFVGGTPATINVYDSEGELVRSVNLGTVEAGPHDFQWDGLNDDGEAVEDGTYRFEVVQTDSLGDALPTELTVIGEITGVRFLDGNVLLQMGDQSFTMSRLVALGTTV